MRLLLYVAAIVAANPAFAQIVNPPRSSAPDLSGYATKADVQAAQTAAANADTKATAAQSTAQTAASNTVKTVNGLTPDANGAVTLAIPSLSGYATTTAVNNMINTATSGVVKTVNAVTPNASGAITLAIPTASTTVPPCIGDAGSAGTAGTMQFAPFNHTHCSKARRIIATSATDGTYTYNYSANPFTNPPVCVATAEVASGVTDVINVQTVGTPTTTSASFLVNRTQRSVASLIGLTVLSVPASPGATKIHIICIEP